MSKQWTLSVLFLLSYPLFSSSMQKPSRQPGEKNIRKTVQKGSRRQKKETVQDRIQREQKERAQYHGATVKEMKKALKRAPEDSLLIIDHLKDPVFFDQPDYRFNFFVGEPGTGKSITAKAIAYILKQDGWHSDFFSATAIRGKNRGEKGQLLGDFLDATVAVKRKTLLIIDELNQLLEHAESKDHDTDETSKILWTFLDDQIGNNDFFLIGIMNRCHKIPEQIKSRAQIYFIKGKFKFEVQH